MTNHRLRGAMLNSGMTAGALAAVVQVDAKSVSRWINEDRLPHPATRASVARALNQGETFLWPALLQAEDGCVAAAVEAERVWPTRSAISSETWHALFSRSAEELDIQVYAGAFLIETLDLADVLEWKASKGTRVRILVGDPDSETVRMRARELSTDWLPERCRSTLDYLRRVAGINVRPHGTIHYASLFRFDNVMLANTHAFGAWHVTPRYTNCTASARASCSTSGSARSSGRGNRTAGSTRVADPLSRWATEPTPSTSSRTVRISRSERW